MYILPKRLFQTVSIVCLCASTLLAQDAIYNFTFDDDLEGWTPVGVFALDTSKSSASLWRHSADGSASSGAYASDLNILSLSGGGAALFDSDGLDNNGVQGDFGAGPAPAPQIGELVSPTLDFSGVETVYLAFNQFYRYFADNASASPIDRTRGTAAFIEVSGDGGASFTTYEVNTDARPNRATPRDDQQVIDISAEAANSAEVVVKLVWDGDYYFWLVDDIRFYSELGIDLAIEEYTVPDNYETPDFAFAGDSIDLEILITNNGDMAASDSIECVARILDIDLNTIWSDTGYIDESIDPDSSIIWDFDEVYVPDLLTQNTADDAYLVVYSVGIKGDTVGEPVQVDDNLEFENFQVRDLTFRKVPGGSGFGFNGDAGGGDPEPYDWANFFSLPASFEENLAVSTMFFDAFNPGDDLAGNSVILYVVELPENVGDPSGTLLAGEGVEVDNFDFSMNLDAMIEANMIVGIGTYAFTADDDENGGPFFGDVFDFFDEELPVVLKPGRKYLFAVRYPSGSELIAQEVSRDYKLWQLATLASFPSVNGGNWTVISTGGDNPTFYSENIASIGFDVEIIVSVDDVPLPEETVKVFPVPANDKLQVDLAFEKPLNTNIFLADASGKILVAKVIPNVVNHLQEFDVSRYPAGNYLIRVVTEEGTRTQKIVISH